MGGTFLSCSSLVIAPKLSKNTTTMFATFMHCVSLQIISEIPDKVTNMHWTFLECTSLVTAPSIPNSVTNMYSTFQDCTSLATAPSIPNSVTILCATFKNCSNLHGILEINANVNGTQLGSEYYNNIDYNNCLLGATTSNDITLKLSGSCTVLAEIVSNANNPNITIK